VKRFLETSAQAVFAWMIIGTSPLILADGPPHLNASPDSVIESISTKGVEFRVSLRNKTLSGEPVFVEISIRNNTDRPMKRSDMGDTDYDIRLANFSGEAIRLTPYAAAHLPLFGTIFQSSGSHRLVEIAPGDAFSTRVELTKYFILPVDRYYLQISAPVYANDISQDEDLEFKAIKFEVVSPGTQSSQRPAL
jgi:hypothetical protein